LHVARGVLLTSILVVFFLQSHVSAILRGASLFAFCLAAFAWVLVWRVLSREHPPRWVPYLLILADAWLGLRGAIAVQTRFYSAIGADRYLTQAELAALGAPLLALVAVSGAVRLVPRMAAYSTAVAVLSYVYVAAALGVSWNLGFMSAVLIAFMGVLGVQVARVFRHTMVKAREEAILERYVPAALVDELVRTGSPGSGREAQITVVLVDMRGFTRLVEHLSPRQAVALLNDYFSIVAADLAAEGAVLDKYIGDGVLAFFEGPRQQLRALRAGRAILDSIEGYNRSRPASTPIVVGIAIHTGLALVGTIGAVEKREYTAISDTVNLAARLEELNKTFGSNMVVSEAVIQAVNVEERAAFVGPIITPIRGREASIEVRYLSEPDRQRPAD
jgi:class 3 adenylate cyclase